VVQFIITNERIDYRCIPLGLSQGLTSGSGDLVIHFWAGVLVGALNLFFALYVLLFATRQKPAERRVGGNQHTANNCIAIGLASRDFPLEGLMPGWDSRSYAFHSDDGGIFHGTGIKVSSTPGAHRS
jgi:hypothetical protein